MKITLVFLSRFSEMYAISFYFSFVPLTHIHISFDRFPHSCSVFFIPQPLTWIVLSILPKKLANFCSLVVNKLAFIDAFFCDFNALKSLITTPFSFKNPSFRDHYTLSINNSISYVSKIEWNLLLKLHTKIRTLNQFININCFIFHFVVFNEICNLIFTRNRNQITILDFLGNYFLFYSNFFRFCIMSVQCKHINFYKLFTFQNCSLGK